MHQLRSRLSWLPDRSSIVRLAPAVHRFAVEGWTVDELAAAVDRQLDAREIAVPLRLRQPEIYFAWLIGPVDEHNPFAGGNAHAGAVRARRDQAGAEAAALPVRQATAITGIAACRAALKQATARRTE